MAFWHSSVPTNPSVTKKLLFFVTAWVFNGTHPIGGACRMSLLRAPIEMMTYVYLSCKLKNGFRCHHFQCLHLIISDPTTAALYLRHLLSPPGLTVSTPDCYYFIIGWSDALIDVNLGRQQKRLRKPAPVPQWSNYTIYCGGRHYNLVATNACIPKSIAEMFNVNPLSE